MYSRYKQALLDFFKLPESPPEPPGSPESAMVFQASKNYLRKKQITQLWGTFLGLVVLGLAGFAFSIINFPYSNLILIGLGLLIVATLVSAVLQFFYLKLDYDFRYYVVTDRGIRIREGIINLNESTFTHSNVQNLSIQTPLSGRIFGYQNLVVETAGGGGSTKQGLNQVSFSNVLKGINNAEEVRDKILERRKHFQGDGLSETTPGDEETTDSKQTFNSKHGKLLREIYSLLRKINKDFVP